MFLLIEVQDIDPYECYEVGDEYDAQDVAGGTVFVLYSYITREAAVVAAKRFAKEYGHCYFVQEIGAED